MTALLFAVLGLLLGFGIFAVAFKCGQRYPATEPVIRVGGRIRVKAVGRTYVLRLAELTTGRDGTFATFSDLSQWLEKR